ncbi:hypothetical protein LshimejAT787_0408860 [Lyophyllum shimeji]|uniref:Uncharacterized protein n=1 Tax=Lyophyllum shimeji TaxID=47721 RepID=A0A9P3PKY9_LYOSH|nr:hypothetical protein LshimejAT787_0408860 [Lyophyllum shimeji]
MLVLGIYSLRRTKIHVKLPAGFCGDFWISQISGCHEFNRIHAKVHQVRAIQPDFEKLLGVGEHGSQDLVRKKCQCVSAVCKTDSDPQKGGTEVQTMRQEYWKHGNTANHDKAAARHYHGTRLAGIACPRNRCDRRSRF